MNPASITGNASEDLNGSAPVNLLSSLTTTNIGQKEISQFASALAHEVRNPLTNINLAVEMLKSTIPNNDQNVYLDIITRSTGRINNLVTDLLTSYQAGEMPAKEHSIHKLLDEVLVSTEDRIKLKNIVVTKDYTSPDCIILMNEQKIRTALTNIIINAIDAMASKNGELKLVTKTTKDKCLIEIEDNGIGISDENLKNIFKPYFTNKPGGMGLGLSTTLNILLSNHAGIAVESEEGKGTRFILSFDRIQPVGNPLDDNAVCGVA